MNPNPWRDLTDDFSGRRLEKRSASSNTAYEYERVPVAALLLDDNLQITAAYADGKVWVSSDEFCALMRPDSKAPTSTMSDRRKRLVDLREIQIRRNEPGHKGRAFLDVQQLGYVAEGLIARLPQWHEGAIKLLREIEDACEVYRLSLQPKVEALPAPTEPPAPVKRLVSELILEAMLEDRLAANQRHHEVLTSLAQVKELLATLIARGEHNREAVEAARALLQVAA